MLVDFHMHSTYSDGRLSASDLVKTYYNVGIKTISITDHDEYGAILELGRHPYEDLTIVPGIEFSSFYKGKDVHILCYDYDVHNKELHEYVSFYKENRQSRIIKMIDKAKKLGYDISYKDLLNQFGENKSFGRPHLGKLLIDKGYVQSMDEAFSTLICKNGPIYEPKFNVEPQRILKLIHTLGGTSVLAHPILIRNDEYVSELLDMGFDGIEVYHPKHKSQDDIQRYLNLANKYNLLVSGGSDYHAIPGRYPEKVGEYQIEDNKVRLFLEHLNLV